MKKLKEPLPVKKIIRDPRTQVLDYSSKMENTASQVLKNLLRLVKPNSHSIDSKSSSLSFKNKIDLLYDIDDLDKSQYSSLLMFIEIRKIFIDNLECSTFSDLTMQAPHLTKYISKEFKNDIEETERSLRYSFRDLIARAWGALLILKEDYEKGETSEMNRYIDSKTIQNFDSIFNSAYVHWKKYRQSQEPKILSESFNNEDKEIQSFEKYLKYHLLNEKIKLLEKLTKGNSAQKDMNLKRIELHKKYTSEKKEIKVINK